MVSDLDSKNAAGRRREVVQVWKERRKQLRYLNPLELKALTGVDKVRVQKEQPGDQLTIDLWSWKGKQVSGEHSLSQRSNCRLKLTSTEIGFQSCYNILEESSSRIKSSQPPRMLQQCG